DELDVEMALADRALRDFPHQGEAPRHELVLQAFPPERRPQIGGDLPHPLLPGAGERTPFSVDPRHQPAPPAPARTDGAPADAGGVAGDAIEPAGTLVGALRVRAAGDVEPERRARH